MRISIDPLETFNLFLRRTGASLSCSDSYYINDDGYISEVKSNGTIKAGITIPQMRTYVEASSPDKNLPRLAWLPDERVIDDPVYKYLTEEVGFAVKGDGMTKIFQSVEELRNLLQNIPVEYAIGQTELNFFPISTRYEREQSEIEACEQAQRRWVDRVQKSSEEALRGIF